MKSLVLHYRNKYPKGQVQFTDSSLDVYSASGEHVIAMRRNGANQLVDMSSEFGLRDSHDLAPIPKESRAHKMVDGKLGKSEEHDERVEMSEEFLCPKHGDKVLSCDELKKLGMKFDEKHSLVK